MPLRIISHLFALIYDACIVMSSNAIGLLVSLASVRPEMCFELEFAEDCAKILLED
jgi:hypothetical protein